MMKSNYKIIFSASALQDINEAKQWYNTQQKGLGNRLVQDVKIVIEAIKRNPEFASIKFESIRTASCKIFPYSVHYELDENNQLIRVISIFHFSRKPYWL